MILFTYMWSVQRYFPNPFVLLTVPLKLFPYELLLLNSGTARKLN